eukprot:scaffold15151_cov63-Phaeocystis_antarctica.AAC.3
MTEAPEQPDDEDAVDVAELHLAVEEQQRAQQEREENRARKVAVVDHRRVELRAPRPHDGARLLHDVAEVDVELLKDRPLVHLALPQQPRHPSARRRRRPRSPPSPRRRRPAAPASGPSRRPAAAASDLQAAHTASAAAAAAPAVAAAAAAAAAVVVATAAAATAAVAAAAAAGQRTHPSAPRPVAAAVAATAAAVATPAAGGAAGAAHAAAAAAAAAAGSGSAAARTQRRLARGFWRQIALRRERERCTCTLSDPGSDAPVLHRRRCSTRGCQRTTGSFVVCLSRFGRQSGRRTESVMSG